MIHEFQLPCIVDTKNIYKRFAKARYIDKQTIPMLKKISTQRKAAKETLKHLTGPKLEETPPFNLIDEVLAYAESAANLDSIFQKDYTISKNWKWSPFLSQTKILKYIQTIKVGKSGEILMSRYAAFAACFRTVKPEINFIKQNIMHRENFNLDPELSFASLMKKKPIVNKLEESIMKVLKVHIKAWMLLKKCYDCSGPSFKSLETYSEKYIESTSAGMEMTLLITKINTNMLYVEYLRYQGNYEEMGKYAKMIVTQAFLVENIIKSYNFYVDPKLYSFVQICQKLYKAIALWSLLFPYSAKLQTGTYDDGDDMNILAGGCNSFVLQIGKLHREILNLPNMRSSPLFSIVSLYFKDILVTKSLEVNMAYGQVFAGYAYDEFHFDRMTEIDYIGRATGDDTQYQRSA